MVVGIMIGASIFVQPSEITGRVPSVPGILAVWVVSGLLTLVGALVCAELASVFVRSGGVYVYLRELYSPAAGFLWGWAMFWSIHSGIIAAVSVIFARYAAFFLPLTPFSTRVVAIGAVLALSAVNYFGVRLGSIFQTSFTIGKVLAILTIVILAFALGARLCPAISLPRLLPGPPCRPETTFLRLWPGCSPSVGGTWSPTTPKKPKIPKGPSRVPCCSER